MQQGYLTEEGKRAGMALARIGTITRSKRVLTIQHIFESEREPGVLEITARGFSRTSSTHVQERTLPKGKKGTPIKNLRDRFPRLN